MKHAIGPALVIGGLLWSAARALSVAEVSPPPAAGQTPAPFQTNLAAPTPTPFQANSAAPVPLQTNSAAPVPLQTNSAAPVPLQTNSATPVPLQTSLVVPGPGTQPASSVNRPGSPYPAGPATAMPVPPDSTLAPGPSSSSTRVHLHRPGTDVDADALTGSLASNVFILRGNVVLNSDPKIDREIGDASESDDPLKVTADEIDIDKFALTYVAKGHVHFVQGDRSGHADVAMLDEQKHTLDLVGNADVLDGDHRAAAAKMHYNTADKQFLGSGDVRIYEPLPTPNPNASSTPAPKHKRRFPI